MSAFARSDISVLGRWWWTVDRLSLLVVVALAAFGLLLAASASPSVAERLGLDSTYFLRRQALYLFPALLLMFFISLLNIIQVRRVGLLIFAGSFGLLCATPLIGTEVNGAMRWISVAGFSLQPSEFIKPGFAIFSAWIFSISRLRANVPGARIVFCSYALVVALLMVQPDLGQSVIVTAIWFSQWFLAGLPTTMICGLILLATIFLFGAYISFPHVTSRIDRFFDPKTGDTYQIDKALEAFTNGGILGTGPGQGIVKTRLPDAHTDFIFAVVGEEYGLIACLVLVIAFAFVVLRGLFRLMRETDLFVVLAAAGLLVQFGIQALINMGSTVNLLPTKGMTLPFISYGGSSLFGLAAGMGMALALTRARPRGVE